MKTFEERLKRLEEINGQIRNGEIDLKKSLALFEEGIRLAKKLEKELEKAEHTVEVLLEDEEIENDTIDDANKTDKTDKTDNTRNRTKKTPRSPGPAEQSDESLQLFDFGLEDHDQQKAVRRQHEQQDKQD